MSRAPYFLAAFVAIVPTAARAAPGVPTPTVASGGAAVDPGGRAAARLGPGIPPDWIEHRVADPHPSLAYAWVNVVLEVTGREVDQVGARPTIISRQMAIALTAMYDAWAAYDDTAVGTRLGASLRRPAAERTPEHKAEALSYATFRALVDLFPKDRDWLAAQMRQMGYDPDDVSTDVATPSGVGNLAAAAVLDYRRRDGANQLGDEAGSTGESYSDYTFYEPRNPIDRIVDPDRWQPIPFSDGKGGTFHPGFLTPHWYRVKPFALLRADQFRPPPYPKVGSAELAREVEECIAYNGSLSLEQKAIVEFMRDGPRSTGQSGHWLQFAQDVSRRDGYGLDRDVELFFTIANTAFDAFIAAWDAKRVYDSSRPWTLIRHYYGERTLVGYLGPGKGFGTIPAPRWHPYSPATFVTPPFPGYPSGHSTVSGACAKMLELFTGSDRYGAYERHAAGKWTEPNVPVARMQARGGQAATGLPDGSEVVLVMPTFSATAEMAGLSRVMGGYHIRSDNTAGLALGRTIAEHTWPTYRAYFDGTAPTEPRPVPRR